MSCSPAVVFAWLGALIINAAFLSVISYASVELWPLGLVLTAVYTGVLIFLGLRLRPKESEDSSAADRVIASDLLLLLSCFGLAACGAFLPANLIRCGMSFGGEATTVWVTDTTGMSATVAAWAVSPSSLPQASFAYLTHKGTLFRGEDGGVSTLWLAPASGAAPQPLGADVMHSPIGHVAVGDERACLAELAQCAVPRPRRDAAKVSKQFSTNFVCWFLFFFSPPPPQPPPRSCPVGRLADLGERNSLSSLSLVHQGS